MANQKQIVRTCLLYEFKLGSNASEACRKICMAFGEEVIKERTARNWFQKFAFGDESLEDAPRSGRPLSLSYEDLRTAIEMNSELTCGELAAIFNVSEETIRSHLHRLGKRWKLSKWVSYNLIPENELEQLTICSPKLARSKTKL